MRDAQKVIKIYQNQMKIKEYLLKSIVNKHANIYLWYRTIKHICLHIHSYMPTYVNVQHLNLL